MDDVMLYPVIRTALVEFPVPSRPDDGYHALALADAVGYLGGGGLAAIAVGVYVAAAPAVALEYGEAVFVDIEVLAVFAHYM